MIGAEYVERGTIPEPRHHYFRLVGQGNGNAPTLAAGRGATISRSATGDYKLTWSETPGNYIYGSPALESSAGTDIKNFSVIVIPFVTATKVLELLLFNASGTAVDLLANQFISIDAFFKETAVT